MKKIPTLYERIFENGRVAGVTERFSNEEVARRVLYGGGVYATVKVDGSCCACIDGVFYKRYDAKKGKAPPPGAIPCEPMPDPITGHWPHWLAIYPNNKSDRWFIEAADNYGPAEKCPKVGTFTFEAIGPHFNANPYKLEQDVLVPHGTSKIPGFSFGVPLIRQFLSATPIEGVVFWDRTGLLRKSSVPISG